MNYPGGSPARSFSLRAAAATVHQDPQWWFYCLSYGFAASTVFGLPLAAGFVLDSLDNSRRGYPIPLPPWNDPVQRAFTGVFALLIDFTFFVVPLLAGLLLTLCSTVALIIAGAAGQAAVAPTLTLLFTFIGVVILSFWFCSLAPVGRLMFVREGQIEHAISGSTFRWATGPHGRSPFLRARLASLPAYLPAALFAAATIAITRPNFPGQVLAVGLGLWLTLSALVYAHLIVVQLYVSAEKEVQRRELGL